MPLVPLAVNNILEFRVHGLCQNQEVINRLHFRAFEGTVGGGDVTSEDLLNELVGDWRTVMIPIMLTTYGVYQYSVARVTEVTWNVVDGYRVKYDQQVVEGGDAAQDTGTLAAGDQLPVFVAMDLQKRCTIVSKYTRGSIRISPHNETHQVGGSWEAARATAVKAALDQFCVQLVPIVGGAVRFRHVVFSLSQASKVTPGPVWPLAVAENVNQYVVNPLVSSQTTRKIRQAGY